MPQKKPIVTLVDENEWSKDACICISTRGGANWRFPVRLNKATMTISNGLPECSTAVTPRPPASVIDTFDRLRPRAVQMLCGTDLLINEQSRARDSSQPVQLLCF